MGRSRRPDVFPVDGENDNCLGFLLGVSLAKRPVCCVIDPLQVAGWDFDGVVPLIKNLGRPRLGLFQTGRSGFTIVGRKATNDRQHRNCGTA